MFSKLFEELKKEKRYISVIGLGYVGLPLAVAFAKKFKVIGFADDFPITEYQSVEFLLDNRHLWLRSRKLTEIMKLKAKINGVNKTPTLVLDDGTILKGKQQIIDYFNR